MPPSAFTHRTMLPTVATDFNLLFELWNNLTNP